MTLQWEAQVVGINYYPNYTTLHSLTAAANDAEAVAIQLETYGYQTFRLQRLPRQANQKGEWQINPEEGVSTLELQEAIANLFNPPDGQAPETALFFFSGHGWRKTVNGKEEVFLATSDVLPDEEIYGVPLSWLGEQLTASQSKQIIVWLDCCFSGELLKYLPTNKDYCLITATRSYEPGIEIVHQEGLFTQALREGLNPDNYPDGIVDCHSLARFLERRMAQTAQAPRFAISERSILLTTKFNQKNFQDRCPYRSLSFFREKPEDAQVFYGRTELTRQLVERVREKQRLIAVFGASGSGKSSLIRAGLLYQLKLGQAIAGSNNWTYLEPFTPTDEPLQRLAEADNRPHSPPILGGTGSTIQSPPNLGDLGGNKEDLRSNQNPIILIIDQFEECFTMCEEEKRKAFIDYLTELLNSTANLQIIIGMRDDFRGRLREFPAFTKQMSKVNIGHLNHEEIREAIEKPAEWVGLGIGEGLKQQLINDVEDYPGSLPLLQYTLTELWNEAQKQGERFLRLETYQELGGIEGTLEKRADAVYESLSEEEKSVAKRIFLELTQVGDTLDTRRRVRLGELVNSHHSLKILDRVTLKLANEQNRLITRTEMDEEVSQGKSQIIIDVVHEALIRHWKRLQEWQKYYQSAMVIERKIEASAQEWEEKGKKPEDLLPKTRLAAAEEYLKSFSESGMLDGMAEEFIIESRKRKRVVRRNWIVGGTTVSLLLIGLTIASTLFGVEANSQKAIAQKQERIAKEKAKEAKQQAELAKSNAKEAKRQFNEAQIASRRAVENEKRATQNALEAENNRRKAENSRIATETEKKRAEDNLILAQDNERKAKKNAVEAQKQTSIANANLQKTISVLTNNSQELFESHKEFDALLTSLNAAKQLKQLAFRSDPDTEMRVKDALRDAVFWVKEQNRLEGHYGSVNSVSFSSNGLLASGSADGTIKLWDVTTGKVIKTLDENKIKVNSVSFSSNGLLASGSVDGTIKLWDVTTGKVIKTLDGNKVEVKSISFSPDGRLLASSCADYTIKLWDVTTGKKTKTLTGHKAEVNSISFSANGLMLASGSADGTLGNWDVATSKGKTFFPTGTSRGSIDIVSFSPDSKTLAFAGEDHTIKLWNVDKEAIINNLSGHSNRIRSVSFSHNGQILASAGWDNTIELWDVATGQKIKTLTGHKAGIESISFNPNGNLLASASSDNTIKLWDIKLWDINPRQEVIPLNGVLVGDGISFSRDGKLLASTTTAKFKNQTNTIKLWDMATHQVIATLTGHGGWIRSVSFSPDGQWLASAAWDGTIRLWDVRACIKATICQASKTLQWNSWLNSVSFSPDGRLVASGSWDFYNPKNSSIQLWDVATGREKNLTGHSHQVHRVSFSRDGKLLASGSADKTIKIWDVAKGKEIKTLTGHSDGVRGVSFSPEGKRLASASNDQTIKLWDVATGKKINTLKGHTSPVIGVSFSPDGKSLVSGSEDRTIKLWDVVTGKEINTLKGHRNDIRNLSLSDDGQLLVSQGDEELILWNVKILSNLTLENLIGKGCDWLRGYLENNPHVVESDRHLCDVKPIKSNAKNG